MAMVIGKGTVNAITGEMMSDVTAVIAMGVAMMIMAGEDMELVMMTTAVHVGRIEMVVVERTEETSGVLEVVSVRVRNVARRRPKAALPSPSGSGKPQGGMFTLRATSSTLLCKPNKQGFSTFLVPTARRYHQFSAFLGYLLQCLFKALVWG